MYSSSSPLYSDSSTEIDSLACSSLPEFFYRVQYGSTSTKTTFDMENGFLADDPDLMINNLTTLKDRVQLAFTWSSRSASPFINVFSDRTHAENWALKWCRDGGIIYKISMAELGDMKVFKLSTMVQQFNIELVDGARQHEEGAYLCLHHIPIEAVMSYLDADNIANERQWRTQSQFNEVDNADEEFIEQLLKSGMKPQKPLSSSVVKLRTKRDTNAAQK